MARFSILLGGSMVPTGRLIEQVRGTRTIAADGGIVHAAALGLAPELWIGDFDSTGPDLLARHVGLPRIELSPDKDMTDGAHAIAEARARGAREAVLVGALGGQADHLLGHFTLALRHAAHGLRLLLTSGTEEAYPLVPGIAEIALEPGSRISIVAMTDLDGLTLSGVRWPLREADVEMGSTLTLSNVATGPVRIELKRGRGIVIAYPAEPRLPPPPTP